MSEKHSCILHFNVQSNYAIFILPSTELLSVRLLCMFYLFNGGQFTWFLLVVCRIVDAN